MVLDWKGGICVAFFFFLMLKLLLWNSGISKVFSLGMSKIYRTGQSSFLPWMEMQQHEQENGSLWHSQEMNE